VAQSLGSLDEDNQRAWTIFQRLQSRFLLDHHASSVALDRLTRDLSHADCADLFDRLRVLYDIVCPPPERKS
jgi:hypothetical protein